MRAGASPRRNSIQSRNAGFTFLEMLVVVIILGVLSAAVMPVFSASFRGISARDAKTGLLATLAHTQESAVRDSREYRFYLDPKERRYWAARHTGMGEDGKRFTAVTDKWGLPVVLPTGMEVGRPKMRKDDETGAYYLTCYPNGACDIGSIAVQRAGRGGEKFEIETLGAMGQFEVKD